MYNTREAQNLDRRPSPLCHRFTNWSPEVDGATGGYRFADPALPSFDLPEASGTDVLLTTTNSVVTKTGAVTETFCNGDSAEYYGEDGNWYNKVGPLSL